MICQICNTEFQGDACPECGAQVASFANDRIAAGAALLKEGLPDQAIEALDLAIASDPRSYEAHSLLGAAYLRRGEPELASHHFERAVWLDPGLAAARYNLAMAYRAAGRRADALEQARAALAKDPGHAKSKALLRDLERAAEAPQPEPGSPLNRPRAAAPHLEAVVVPGKRLSNPLLITIAALVTGITLVIGELGYAWMFRLLTSPQLASRENLLWVQLPYAMGAVMFVAGVSAASFQARGFPLAGFAAGMVALPIGVRLLLVGEGVPVTGRIIAGAAIAGAVSVAAIEAFGKFTRIGEFRRTLLLLSILGMVAYAIIGYFRQGSLRGYIMGSAPAGSGQVAAVRVPDAEVVLQDPRSKLVYSTRSWNGEEDGRTASARGGYRLYGMPVGTYLLTVLDRQTGASWQGRVYVDYAVIRGNELEVNLQPPGQPKAAETDILTDH